MSRPRVRRTGMMTDIQVQCLAEHGREGEPLGDMLLRVGNQAGTLRETARRLEIHEVTLRQWLHRQGISVSRVDRLARAEEVAK